MLLRFQGAHDQAKSRQVSASVAAAAIGCLISCANEAVSSPIEAIRVICARDQPGPPGVSRVLLPLDPAA